MSRAQRWITTVLVATGLLAFGVAIWSLLAGGIGWDSTFDTYATSVARAIPSGTSLHDAYGAVPVTTEFYGLLVYQLADIAHHLATGADSWLDPYDAQTYLWQGGVNLLFSLLAAISLGIAVGRALRSLAPSPSPHCCRCRCGWVWAM